MPRAATKLTKSKLDKLRAQATADPTFVAYRLGRGLVIRPGVRGFSRALDEDVGPVAETLRRIWTLLG